MLGDGKMKCAGLWQSDKASRFKLNQTGALRLSCFRWSLVAGHITDEVAVRVRESTATARSPSVKYGSPVRLRRGAFAGATSTPETKPSRATRRVTSRFSST